MISDGNRPKFWQLWFYAAFTLAFAILTLWLAYDAAAGLISDIYGGSGAVTIRKGGFYGIGGLGALTLFFGLVGLLANGKLTRQQEKIMGKMLLISVVLMLALPHLVHYSAVHFLKGKNFQECDALAERWLHDRTIVYAKNSGICDQLLQDKIRKEIK